MKKKLLQRRNNIKKRLLLQIPNAKEKGECNKKWPRNWAIKIDASVQWRISLLILQSINLLGLLEMNHACKWWMLLWEKNFKTLTIPHLKTFLNAEHNTFKKEAKNSNWTLRRVETESFLTVCVWWCYFIKQGQISSSWNAIYQ